MKTTKSLTKKATVVLTCASLMLLTVGAWTAFAAGATLQENEAIWGKPISIQKLDNGAEKRFYKYQNTGAMSTPYFVYQDGKVVEEGLAVTIPETKKAAKMGLSFDTASTSFYQNHPTTAQELDAIWGKVVAVRTLEDGSQERYYKYQNTQNWGYHCYLVKDGKVLGATMASVIAIPEKQAEPQGVRLPLNAAVANPGIKTVAEVEETWGRPVTVKKLANGTEERYYKWGNTALSEARALFLFKDGKLIASAVAK
ncbi:MAG: hypothetical protein LLG97_20440 [Deltaproteobacteria bacterium]|nr:hypothetical protein [Deltaproteobacteria bacterium]